MKTSAWLLPRACGFSVAAALALCFHASTSVAGTAPPAPKDGTLRIASWNLLDLWHEPNVPLMASSKTPTETGRSTRELARLKTHASAIKFDVIALQGVGSPQAVRRLFPARTFVMVFSRQLAARLGKDKRSLSDPRFRQSYTAIVMRKRKGLRMMRRAQFLNMSAPLKKKAARQTTSSVGVQLRMGRKSVWVISTMLDGRCPKISRLDGKDFKTFECKTREKQMLALDRWITATRKSKQKVIVAGNFGRASEHVEIANFWSAFKDVKPSSKFVKLLKEDESTSPKSSKPSARNTSGAIGSGQKARKLSRVEKYASDRIVRVPARKPQIAERLRGRTGAKLPKVGEAKTLVAGTLTRFPSGQNREACAVEPGRARVAQQSDFIVLHKALADKSLAGQGRLVLPVADPKASVSARCPLYIDLKVDAL